MVRLAQIALVCFSLVGLYGLAQIVSISPGFQSAVLAGAGCCFFALGIGRIVNPEGCRKQQMKNIEYDAIHAAALCMALSEHLNAFKEGMRHEFSTRHPSDEAQPHDLYFCTIFVIVFIGMALWHSM